MAKDAAPKPDPDDDKDGPAGPALDADDIALLTSYGAGPYAAKLRAAEKELKELAKAVDEACGVKESDTGLAPPSRWDLVSDKQAMGEEQPLQVSCVVGGWGGRRWGGAARRAAARIGRAARRAARHRPAPMPGATAGALAIAPGLAADPRARPGCRPTIPLSSFAGRALHQDHQPQHGRRQVRH
jgi:hypothetical protein